MNLYTSILIYSLAFRKRQQPKKVKIHEEWRPTSYEEQETLAMEYFNYQRKKVAI